MILPWQVVSHIFQCIKSQIFCRVTGCTQVNYSVLPEYGYEVSTPLVEVAKALRPMSVDLLLKHGARVDIGHPLHLFSDLGWHIFNRENFDNKDYLTVGAQLIRHGAVIDVSLLSGWRTVDKLLCAHGGIENAGEWLGTDLLRLILKENAIKLSQENSTVTVELISDADYDMFFSLLHNVPEYLFVRIAVYIEINGENTERWRETRRTRQS